VAVFQLEKVNMKASLEYCICRARQTHRNRQLRDPHFRIDNPCAEPYVKFSGLSVLARSLNVHEAENNCGSWLTTSYPRHN
jgi:hypothetical protein